MSHRVSGRSRGVPGDLGKFKEAHGRSKCFKKSSSGLPRVFQDFLGCRDLRDIPCLLNESQRFAGVFQEVSVDFMVDPQSNGNPLGNHPKFPKTPLEYTSSS